MKTIIIIALIAFAIVFTLYAAIRVGSRADRESDEITAKTGQNKTISNTGEYFPLKENNGVNSGEYCVICGKEIPEGRQVCPSCEIMSNKKENL